MRAVCFALILLIALPCASLAATHDQEPPPDLTALFERGVAAVQTSTVSEDEDERDELLDEAIEAFRQMLVVDPGLVRVRLELALAFYLKGEDSLARQHFEAVLAGGVPSEVEANVQGFLIQIRARRRWIYNAGFALAPDTNIGAGSEERIILIPVFGQELPFERDAAELTTSGVGLVLWGSHRSTVDSMSGPAYISGHASWPASVSRRHDRVV